MSIYGLPGFKFRFLSLCNILCLGSPLLRLFDWLNHLDFKPSWEETQMSAPKLSDVSSLMLSQDVALDKTVGQHVPLANIRKINLGCFNDCDTSTGNFD